MDDIKVFIKLYELMLDSSTIFEGELMDDTGHHMIYLRNDMIKTKILLSPFPKHSLLEYTVIKRVMGELEW